MTQNRDLSALLDIYAAVEKILAFSHGFDEDRFFADDRTQSAVLHQLMIIGEAVKRLSPDFRLAHPEIRWTPMAGMRDVLIHAYDTVDLDEVWQTVLGDIPKLKNDLRVLLPPGLKE
ncbi:conserved protein of unknown function [Candidatus Promineifilum breve]|uniref:DUF86 domain-containing protein n=1 Tax=Candidatus Promineifilum breve TaxID=1806508 RepID=A0A160T5A5_9CHLR|nr:DUF86 domain-containing protein [Candidatus Promineifilum breve]CUS04328.2 conserved protein of unknown function [Candidatus Promineifilum breve]